MTRFDFEAGKRFRKQGEIAEALRCFRAALDEDKEHVDTYVELALTYILAFEDSGDPLCLDSARKVCLSGLRREPTEAQRQTLIKLQDRIEDLILESEKAEVDAMHDAMNDPALSPADDPPGLQTDLLEDDDPDDPEKDRGH
jgi:thioredoxin-like negative regulator of GroEL